MYSSNEATIRLHAWFFGIAIGITTGLYMMFFAWAGGIWGYGLPIINEISSVYLGYAPNFIGGLFGGLWGFVDGFIFGIFVGWVYNLCLRCVYRKSPSVHT